MPPPNKTKVIAVQRNAAALLRLLGDDPQHFWEIFRGVTTPGEAKLIDQQMTTAADVVDQVSTQIKALQKIAGGIQG